MLDYFSQRGYSCPKHTNPADFALDLISVDLRSPAFERASYRRLNKLASQYHAYAKSKVMEDHKPEAQQHSKEARNHILLQMKQEHISVFMQTLILIVRYNSLSAARLCDAVFKYKSTHGCILVLYITLFEIIWL